MTNRPAEPPAPDPHLVRYYDEPYVSLWRRVVALLRRWRTP